MRTGRLVKSSRSWYLQWEKENSFAVYRGLVSVTCCMSNWFTWNSKQKVCWDCRKPEKNWLQSRRDCKTFLILQRKMEENRKLFITQDSGLCCLSENYKYILESCNCSIWWALQISIKQKATHKEHTQVTCFNTSNSFTALMLFLSRTNTITTETNKIVKMFSWPQEAKLSF